MNTAPTMRQVVLRKTATGMPTLDNFEVQKDVPVPRPGPGEVLVQVKVLSVDPYMRGRIGGDPSRTSSSPLQPGDVIVGATVGQVVSSLSPDFKAGDFVHAYSGWREYYVLPAARLELIDPVGLEQPLEKFVGVLGMTGRTAFYGLFEVGNTKEGDIVVVSGAAGAVGSVVCQMAKLKGCKVVGIAGSEEKCDYLRNTLGVDFAINYRSDDVQLEAALDEAIPDGVDVYFDNTGGRISDHVIPRIRYHARVVVCGQISGYNVVDGEDSSMGPRLLHHLVWKSARMLGFLVQDFSHLDAETHKQISQWMKKGLIQSKEDKVWGIENAPKAFIGLFEGTNFGKQVVMM